MGGLGGEEWGRRVAWWFVHWCQKLNKESPFLQSGENDQLFHTKGESESTSRQHGPARP